MGKVGVTSPLFLQVGTRGCRGYDTCPSNRNCLQYRLTLDGQFGWVLISGLKKITFIQNFKGIVPMFSCYQGYRSEVIPFGFLFIICVLVNLEMFRYFFLSPPLKFRRMCHVNLYLLSWAGSGSRICKTMSSLQGSFLLSLIISLHCFLHFSALSSSSSPFGLLILLLWHLLQ